MIRHLVRYFNFRSTSIIAFCYALTSTNLGQIHAETAVNVPDVNLAKALKNRLSIPNDEPITAEKLETLKVLDVWGYNHKVNEKIVDLEGLQYAVNLEQVLLRRHKIKSVSQLSGLVNLQQINISENSGSISDISPLSGLENLEIVNLSKNSISNLAPLAGLIKLRSLHLGVNDIVDLSPIAGLQGLQHLTFGSNKITDISVVKEFPDLRQLHIHGNQVTDSTPIHGLSELTNLALGTNSNAGLISDISFVSNLPKLTKLYIGKSEVSDISALQSLVDLEYLEMGHNEIDNIASLSGLVNLRTLRARSNQIEDALRLVHVDGGSCEEVDHLQLPFLVIK